MPKTFEIKNKSVFFTKNRDDFINLIVPNSSLEFVKNRVELVRREHLKLV